jgi:hypothetical protein
VDELPELDEIYSVNPKTKAAAASEAITPQSIHDNSPTGSAATTLNPSDDVAFAQQSSAWTPRSLYSGIQITSPPKRRRTNESDRSSHSTGNPSTFVPFHRRTDSFEASPIRQEDAIDSLLRAADFSDQGVDQTGLLSSPQYGHLLAYGGIQHDTPGAWPHVNIQEACLMRYFIDELACWVSFPTHLSLSL